MLTLKLLGMPSAALDNHPLILKTSKSQALLYYLATSHGFHSRDLLADLLWPNMNTQQARKNLRDALSHLHMQVGDYLLIDRQKLAFNSALPYQSDLHAFITQVAEGYATADLACIESGLAHYQGDFLAGLHVLAAATFEEWLSQQRERYHQQRIETMHWLATAYCERQRYAEGATIARHILRLEPWQENIHRLLMQLLVLDGKRADAVRQYEICRQQLADEMGIEPSVETEQLYLQIREGRLPLPAQVGSATGNLINVDSNHTALTTPSHSTASTTNIVAPFGPVHKFAEETTPAHAIAHNLRRTFTPLIGREQVVNQLQTLLLTTRYPLITLVGNGGAGKTRLALAAAESILALTESPQPNQRLTPLPLPGETSTDGHVDTTAADTQLAATAKQPFKHGIWFVDLSDISAQQTPAQIGEAMAAAIGAAMNLSFGPHGTLSQQVGAALRHQALLLILDNFEHLHAGIPFLLDLLQTAQALQLLVTSRRRLILSAEYLVEVKGLEVPPEQTNRQAPDPALQTQLLSYSAIRLFVECAQRAEPTFQLRAENSAAVVHICRLLEGLPLGIELATTLLTTHSCQEVAAQLQENYALLTTTSADLPLRQRSIKAVLAATWALLTKEEAQLLASCTVLHGAFSLEMLQAITNAPLAQVRHLVHHSLLHYEPATQRFTLHRLVRQYGAERLRAHPAIAQIVAERHAAYFFNFIEQRKQTFANDPLQLQEITDAWENITAAWRWGIKTQAFDRLATSVETLARIYEFTFHLQEAIELFDAAISPLRAQAELMTNESQQRLLANLLFWIGNFLHLRGEDHRTQTLLAELSGWGHQLQDVVIQARVEHLGAGAAEIRLDYQAVYIHTQRAIALLATQREVTRLQIQCYLRLIPIALMLGHFKESAKNCITVLAALEQRPNRALEAYAHLNVGIYNQRSHHYMAARQHLLSAIRLSQSPFNQRIYTVAHCYLGDVLCVLGDYVQAKQYYEAVLTHDVMEYEYDWKGWLYASYGRLLHLSGDIKTARSYYLQLMQQAERPDVYLAATRGMLYLAGLLTECNELAAAAALYQRLAGRLDELAFIHNRADLHAGLALLHLAQGQWQATTEQVSLALAALAAHGLPAIEEPFVVYWRCITVLQALSDQRAPVLVAEAQALIQTQADTISDPHFRQCFLTQNQAVVAILAEAQL